MEEVYLNKIFFGIEKYCTCKYYGDENDLDNFKWFVNIEKVPLLNGFDFEHMIYDYEEIINVENEKKYFEIKFDNNTRFFKKLNMNSYIINSFSLKNYYQPIENLIQQNINFFYLIDCGDYTSIDKIILNEKIINLVRSNFCKILLNTSYEPYSNEKIDFVNILDEFSNKYNLNSKNLVILTGNLIVTNKNKKYEFVPYCYFLEHPWFMEKNLHITENFVDFRFKEIKENIKNKKEEYLTINKNIKLEKKILCYNRRGHPHRRYLFYNLYNNILIRENSFISLNNSDQKNYIPYPFYFGISIEESDKINDFYKNSPNFWSFDGEDLNFNLANQFDESFHKKTFVSLVSETSVLSDVVFFSEKIFKPIYACQPFIISGNPYSLKKLKEIGFKTFEKWWDESYDEELSYVKRLEKIKIILRELSFKTNYELSEMLKDMEDILSHNFDTFINYNNKIHDTLSKKINNNLNLI